MKLERCRFPGPPPQCHSPPRGRPRPDRFLLRRRHPLPLAPGRPTHDL